MGFDYPQQACWPTRLASGDWDAAAWGELEDLQDDVVLLCEICQELQPLGSMLELPCRHSFCLLCLGQHGRTVVEAKRLPVRCPAPGCAAPILQDCEHFLEGSVLAQALQVLAELCIPEKERFFCPHRDCSALMQVAAQEQHGEAVCWGCKRSVCTACRVPWHEGATCAEFQGAPEHERAPEDFKSKRLADSENWRRCHKCGAMVERAQGCPHMTCRCKAEFCYTCGGPWVNGKPTCKCFG